MAKTLMRIAEYYWHLACEHEEEEREFLRLETLGDRAYDLYLSITLYERTYLDD